MNQDNPLELIDSEELVNELVRRCSAIVMTCRFHSDNRDEAGYAALHVMDGDSALCFVFAKKAAIEAEDVFLSSPISPMHPRDSDHDDEED